MLLLLKLIYGETSAADMPQMNCCSDANTDQELMGGLSSLACCSQTLSIICQMLWECVYTDCVETGPPLAASHCCLTHTVDPGSHFPACHGVGGQRR